MPTTETPRPSVPSIHVVPGRNGAWTVRAEAEPAVLSVHPSTTEAERAACRIARTRGSARVVVHDRYCRLHTVAVAPGP